MRRADHSSREDLPNAVRRCVWSRNLKNEEVMTRVGPERHKKITALVPVICVTVGILALFKGKNWKIHGLNKPLYLPATQIKADRQM